MNLSDMQRTVGKNALELVANHVSDQTESSGGGMRFIQLDAWILPVKSASYIKNDLGHHWVCTNRAAVVKSMPLQNIGISTQDLLGS